ncbi:Hsp20/alpha crystallin family protein [Actinomadura gamaensis]|uniref:Hsp20/alpha crystallin family protein n=1 Tax=Actinomadura gamaensis TaxID=1763541 RepID=A0ABV9TW52_9ACTN
MSRMERWEPRSLMPELYDLFESPFGMLRPGTSPVVRIESYTEGDSYVVRAELPGMDPDKDLEITVSHGMLRIRGERQTEEREAHRSEFRYGSFSRAMPIPAGVKSEDIKARYDKGILTVRMPLPETAKQETRRITIQK